METYTIPQQQCGLAQALAMRDPNQDISMLDSMPSIELEIIKQQLDTIRVRIVALQNARSALLQLPGELRNQIFLLAMCAELHERRSGSNRQIFREPGFFATCQQVRRECIGVWYEDLLVWEEESR